jgi:putative hydrolase of HD superfamily
VLRAAHKFSTLRELEMVRAVNEPFRLVEIEKALARDLEDFADLACIRELAAKGKAWLFLTEIEKLRFQTRWNQTPRVPRTSVLGHSFFVAARPSCSGAAGGYPRAGSTCQFLLGPLPRPSGGGDARHHSPVKQATERASGDRQRDRDRIVARELVP